MPKFKVSIRAVEYTDFEIEADTEQAARDAWYEKGSEAGFELGTDYSEADIVSVKEIH